MKHLQNQGGFIKPLFWITVLVFLVYAGIQFGTPYYRYYTFENEVIDLARLSLGNADLVRKGALEAAERLKLPLDDEDIIITKKAKTIQIKTAWSATVDILGFYQKNIDFTVKIEE